MKPNLFRSIYNSLGETFPLLPRIRRSFIGLLTFCILFIGIGFSHDTITTTVLPVSPGKFSNQTIAHFENSVISVRGQLTISNPDLIERILLPNASANLDILTLLFISIASIIIIRIIPKLWQQNLFRKNISNSIRLLGYLIMLYGIVNLFRVSTYVPQKIESLTHNEFTSAENISFAVLCVELYSAMIVIALAGLYQRSIKLQEEQDLTV